MHGQPLIHLRSNKTGSTYRSGILSATQVNHIVKIDNAAFRSRLKTIPDAFKENLRVDYLTRLDELHKTCQEKQCVYLEEFEGLLKKRLVELKLDYTKFSVGGYQKGLYEKCFRMEPTKFMSCSQFLTVMRNVFAFTFAHNTPEEKTLIAIFKSFDVENHDELNWRAFLSMLAMLIKPQLPVMQHIKTMYAIFSSVGSLDMGCQERLSLDAIKDLMQVPILLTNRHNMRNAIDNAW